MSRSWFSAFGAALVALSAALPALGQEQEVEAVPLAGTLKKIKDTGVVSIGYREDAFPFSYLNANKVPIGYSIDLCQEIVETISAELDGTEIKVTFRPVTAGTRMQAVASGEIDLECGSTTNNTARQKEVGFSPIF